MTCSPLLGGYLKIVCQWGRHLHRVWVSTVPNLYAPSRMILLHSRLFSAFQLEFTSDIRTFACSIRIVPLFFFLFAFSRFLRDAILIFLCQTLTGMHLVMVVIVDASLHACVIHKAHLPTCTHTCVDKEYYKCLQLVALYWSAV